MLSSGIVLLNEVWVFFWWVIYHVCLAAFVTWNNLPQMFCLTDSSASVKSHMRICVLGGEVVVVGRFLLLA